MDLKLHLIPLAVGALLLSHCTTAHHDYAGPPPPTVASGSGAPATLDRPGLGTQLGSELYQGEAERAHFYRKSPSTPDAVATFHYNDDEGARLMAELSGKPDKRGGDFELIPGKLRLALVGGYNDRPYPHYVAGGKVFVAGVPGQTYELKLENLTNARMEVIVSIDGLDVMDGRPASVRKSGYVIEPRSISTIRGMRSGGKLKSLIFASVARSQAATAFGASGARNVGVIGVACYEEDEAARRRARVQETYVRGDARAFGR